jgi:hypothetical protein
MQVLFVSYYILPKFTFRERKQTKLVECFEENNLDMGAIPINSTDLKEF